MVTPSAVRLARRRKKKRWNISAKQRRARKKVRAAARAAGTHPTTAVVLDSATEVAADGQQAVEASTEAAEAPDAERAVPLTAGAVPAATEAAEAGTGHVPESTELIEAIRGSSEAIAVHEEASEAAEAVPVAVAAVPVAVAAVPVAVPVTMATVPVGTQGDASCSRAARKKKARGKRPLASFINTLEEDEEQEEYRSFAAGHQASVIESGETRDTSSGRTNATNPTDSDTDYVSSGTNEDSDDSSDSDMYWRIYGKNYEISQLTVTANFASTKQRWNVARINDRRGDTLLRAQYQVLWVSPLVKRRRYYQRTWEPRAQLLADGFRKEIELVDRWKASDVKTFAAFWPTDEYGKNAIGADIQGLCVFNALRRAAELSGHPDIVTQRDIDDFVADQLASCGEDLTKGTSWKVVLVFLRRLRDAGRDFIYRAIALDNFAVAGRRGVRVLREIKLKKGVYIVAAYNHQNIGHAFVLTVQGKTRLIYDLDEGKPVESAENWIDFYAFVRPFIVCKQK
ncbi:hypothetical protein V7S43_007707 [Phytophthora oleae]|uniref:Peptidase C39-like domain-containing protein n=1 Tax=Phytophthora oleae TaxID=2107226 RepID=A0ABD3FMC4_9STRA